MSITKNKMPIVSIQRHRINSDGNGIRTLVHSYGCTLSCKWCCNPETRCLNKYIIATPEELFQTVKLDDVYFLATNGGITFSGGEPLIHKNFIKEFSEKAKDYNWKIGIESAMNIPWDIVEELIPYIDDYLIDIKTMDSNIHKQYTGDSNILILSNIKKLAEICANKIFITIPIIPTVNDSIENLEKTIYFMKENNLKKIKLLPYRNFRKEKYEPMGLEYEMKVTYSEKQFQKLQQIAKERFEIK